MSFLLRAACLISAMLILPLVVPAEEGAAVPRPEHPMPQMLRGEWLNLNGTWEFGETNSDEAARFLSTDAYPDKIVVPFCRESIASGLHRTELVKNVWYRRSFRVPSGWKSKRVRFHVGACDYTTTVWVNGKLAGKHVGGDVAFAFDITDLVKRDGDNTVVIHAFDETNGNQPLGKQSPRGKGYEIFYTPTTGIWQTVWIEGVGLEYLNVLAIDTDLETKSVHLNAELAGESFHDLEIRAVATLDGGTVTSEARPAKWRNNRLVLELPEVKLWMPGNPVLYDLEISLVRGGKTIDRVQSYFGMRDVTIDGRAILINGKAIFQRLVLDQGFYPEGLWTAPSDAALAADIDLSMQVGFNGARLHQKVFEPRFLYHADRKGYLVWGEFPSYNADYRLAIIDTRIIQEWVEIIERDRNHPAIIGWCPFNETPTDATRLQETMLELTRTLDPSRPVIETSGWVHSVDDPEVMDAHDYEQSPEAMRQRYIQKFNGLPERYGVTPKRVPFFVSEYGGIGFDVKEGGWGYNDTPKGKEDWFARFKGLADAQLDNRLLFGFCYTQLTNIDQEQNGIYYHDRRPKFDAPMLHAALSRPAAYEKDPPVAGKLGKDRLYDWRVLVGSKHDEVAPLWRHTTEKPADTWMKSDFDDAAWKAAPAPFGTTEGVVNPTIGTPWTSRDIWLRRDFEFDGAKLDTVYTVLEHDDNATIWLNGEKAMEVGRWNNRYEAFDASAMLPLLKKGKNTLAVHLYQDVGGQYFDMALLGGTSSGGAK
jgi:hypothetical protein